MASVGSVSEAQRERLRREIDQQVREYLARGGEIVSLSGPAYIPHKAVRATGISALEQ